MEQREASEFLSQVLCMGSNRSDFNPISISSSNIEEHTYYAQILKYVTSEQPPISIVVLNELFILLLFDSRCVGVIFVRSRLTMTSPASSFCVSNRHQRLAVAAALNQNSVSCRQSSAAMLRNCSLYRRHESSHEGGLARGIWRRVV